MAKTILLKDHYQLRFPLVCPCCGDDADPTRMGSTVATGWVGDDFANHLFEVPYCFLCAQHVQKHKPSSRLSTSPPAEPSGKCAALGKSILIFEKGAWMKKGQVLVLADAYASMFVDSNRENVIEVQDGVDWGYFIGHNARGRPVYKSDLKYRANPVRYVLTLLALTAIGFGVFLGAMLLLAEWMRP